MLSLYRRGVLGVAGLAPVERVLRNHGWRLGVRRFVAGEDTSSALPALEGLRARGREVILDVLGEYVTDEVTARAMAAEVSRAIGVLEQAGIPPVMSVKPTQVGLAFDEALTSDLVLGVALEAEAAGGRLALDMEDARFVDGTLRVLEHAWRGGARRASSVLQAYLRRTPGDLETMLAAAPDPAAIELRIVKGAYAERPALLLPDMPAIRRAYVALVERAWSAGARVNVATHDEALVRETAAFARGASLPPEKLEYQMIYGVKPKLQQALVDAGQPLRVYVPVGHDWYGYFSRRLAERPANLGVVLRGLAG